jgi:hypothetical protein
MYKPFELLRFSSPARKVALLLCGAALSIALTARSSPPAGATTDTCAYVTGGREDFCNQNTTGDFGQQITVHVGGTACVCLHVRLSNGQVPDVTTSANTNYFSGGHGTFSPKQCYHAVAADANKQFPIYATYHDTCKNVTWTFTSSLHVVP